MKRLFIYFLSTSVMITFSFLAKAQHLEIEGGAKIGGLSGNGTQMVITDNDGNLSSQAIPSGGGSSVWSLNGLNAYYNDGRVGIGTDAPERTFHVYYNNANQNTSSFLISQEGIGDAFMNIGLTNGVHYALGVDNSDGDKFKIGYQPSTAGGVAQNTLLTLENDGSLGLGISSPAADLHLVRSFNTSLNEPMLKIDNNSNQTFGAKTGLSVNTSLDGNTGRNGIQNITSQASTANGTFYGIINNNFPGGSGTSYGIRNLVANSNTPTGPMYGISNNVISHPTSSSTTYGFYSLLEKNGTGKHIGIFNKINGSDGDTALVSINTDPTGFAGYFRGNVRMQDADLIVDGSLGVGTTPLIGTEFQVEGDARMTNLGITKTGSDSYTDAIFISGPYQDGLTINTQFTGVSFQSVYGIYSQPSGLSSNQIIYGVRARPSFSFGSSTIYGVYADKQSGGSGYALYVNGEAFTTGSGMWLTSDRRLKEDIQPMEDALGVIKKLKPSTYLYKKGGKYDLLNFPDRKQYGFIAQEVEEILPDLVKTTTVQFNEDVATPGSEDHFSEEYKAMNYEMLIPVLTQGIKEQQEQIEKTIAQNEALTEKVAELEQQNAELEARLTKLEQLLTQNTNTTIGNGQTQVIELSEAELHQNEPNPFNQSTRIAYIIPNETKTAALYITTASGKLIKQIPIPHRGVGQTFLEAGSLPSGRYQYTLLLDGKIFETKQMVLTK